MTLLEAMLSTVKLRVQQEVNIYQFKVDNIYCQLKEWTLEKIVWNIKSPLYRAVLCLEN